MKTMADSYRTAIIGVVVEEEIAFTLSELCRACGTGEAQVRALVSEGVLDPSGTGPQDWMFDGLALRTVRTVQRLAVDLELGIAGAAIVLDLLEQVAALQSRLRRAGLR
jgi:chaperone modulatory protein CbpM